MLPFLLLHICHNPQGISLQYLLWLKTEFAEAWHSRVTTSQFEKMYLRPRTSRLRCSVADTLAADAATAHFVGPATCFVSHTWGATRFRTRLMQCFNFSKDGRMQRALCCGLTFSSIRNM